MRHKKIFVALLMYIILANVVSGVLIENVNVDSIDPGNSNSGGRNQIFSPENRENDEFKTNVDSSLSLPGLPAGVFLEGATGDDVEITIAGEQYTSGGDINLNNYSYINASWEEDNYDRLYGSLSVRNITAGYGSDTNVRSDMDGVNETDYIVLVNTSGCLGSAGPFYENAAINKNTTEWQNESYELRMLVNWTRTAYNASFTPKYEQLVDYPTDIYLNWSKLGLPLPHAGTPGLTHAAIRVFTNTTPGSEYTSQVWNTTLSDDDIHLSEATVTIMIDQSKTLTSVYVYWSTYDVGNYADDNPGPAVDYHPDGSQCRLYMDDPAGTGSESYVDFDRSFFNNRRGYNNTYAEYISGSEVSSSWDSTGNEYTHNFYSLAVSIYGHESVPGISDIVEIGPIFVAWKKLKTFTTVSGDISFSTIFRAFPNRTYSFVQQSFDILSPSFYVGPRWMSFIGNFAYVIQSTNDFDYSIERNGYSSVTSHADADNDYVMIDTLSGPSYSYVADDDGRSVLMTHQGVIDTDIFTGIYRADYIEDMYLGKELFLDAAGTVYQGDPGAHWENNWVRLYNDTSQDSGMVDRLGLRHADVDVSFERGVLESYLSVSPSTTPASAVTSWTGAGTETIKYVVTLIETKFVPTKIAVQFNVEDVGPNAGSLRFRLVDIYENVISEAIIDNGTVRLEGSYDSGNIFALFVDDSLQDHLATETTTILFDFFGLLLYENQAVGTNLTAVYMYNYSTMKYYDDFCTTDTEVGFYRDGYWLHDDNLIFNIDVTSRQLLEHDDGNELRIGYESTYQKDYFHIYFNKGPEEWQNLCMFNMTIEIRRHLTNVFYAMLVMSDNSVRNVSYKATGGSNLWNFKYNVSNNDLWVKEFYLSNSIPGIGVLCWIDYVNVEYNYLSIQNKSDISIFSFSGVTEVELEQPVSFTPAMPSSEIYARITWAENVVTDDNSTDWMSWAEVDLRVPAGRGYWSKGNFSNGIEKRLSCWPIGWPDRIEFNVSLRFWSNNTATWNVNITQIRVGCRVRPSIIGLEISEIPVEDSIGTNPFDGVISNFTFDTLWLNFSVDDRWDSINLYAWAEAWSIVAAVIHVMESEVQDSYTIYGYENIPNDVDNPDVQISGINASAVWCRTNTSAWTLCESHFEIGADGKYTTYLDTVNGTLVADRLSKNETLEIIIHSYTEFYLGVNCTDYGQVGRLIAGTPGLFTYNLSFHEYDVWYRYLRLNESESPDALSSGLNGLYWADEHLFMEYTSNLAGYESVNSTYTGWNDYLDTDMVRQEFMSIWSLEVEASRDLTNVTWQSPDRLFDLTLGDGFVVWELDVSVDPPILTQLGFTDGTEVSGNLHIQQLSVNGTNMIQFDNTNLTTDMSHYWVAGIARSYLEELINGSGFDLSFAIANLTFYLNALIVYLWESGEWDLSVGLTEFTPDGFTYTWDLPEPPAELAPIVGRKSEIQRTRITLTAGMDVTEYKVDWYRKLTYAATGNIWRCRVEEAWHVEGIHRDGDTEDTSVTRHTGYVSWTGFGNSERTKDRIEYYTYPLEIFSVSRSDTHEWKIRLVSNTKTKVLKIIVNVSTDTLYMSGDSSEGQVTVIAGKDFIITGIPSFNGEIVVTVSLQERSWLYSWGGWIVSIILIVAVIGFAYYSHQKGKEKTEKETKKRKK